MLRALPDLRPERVLAEHAGLVRALCRRLDTEPEDAAAEAWEKVLRALPGFDPAGPASLATWIARITHRHLVDRHRRRRARPGDVPGDDGDEIDLEGAPATGPHLDLERALDALPAAHRRVVVMHHVYGHALEDIAASEGIPLGTVKSRLHRARNRLVEVLA
jgi:RNA polymerase sigma-70 factor (ECF subfamily)